MKATIQLITAGILTLMALPLVAQTPWLPLPRAISITVDRVTEDATQFYRGDKRVDLPFEHFDQDFTWVSAKWGLSDKTAIDARFGHASLDTGAGDADDRADSTFGITRSLRDEFETGDFSLALRATVSLAGSYETGRPHSIGDGEDAWEIGLSAGKYLSPKVAVATSYTMRMNGGNVPNEQTFTVGGNVLVNSTVGLYSIFELQNSSGKLDIGGDGFAPPRFPETQEEFNRIRVGGTVSNSLGNVDVSYAKILDGRNMADFSTISVALTYNLDLFGL